MKFMGEVCTDLPHEYYAPIGEFMFRYAQLEYMLHEIAWRCIDIDNKQGRTLTIGADVSVLRATINTITSTDRWVTTPRIRSEAGYIVGQAKAYAALRNQLAHGSWQFPKSGRSDDVLMCYMKETAEQRLMPQARRPKCDEFYRAAGKLKSVIQRAKKLVAEIERDRPPQQPRPPL